MMLFGFTIAIVFMAAGFLACKAYRDSRESDAESVTQRVTARLARGTVIPLSKVRMRGRHRKSLAEEGRRLAREREDLIAQGVDPSELIIPLHPEDEDRQDGAS